MSDPSCLHLVLPLLKTFVFVLVPILYPYNNDTVPLNHHFHYIWLHLLLVHQVSAYEDCIWSVGIGMVFTSMLRLCQDLIEGSRHILLTSFFLIMNVPALVVHFLTSDSFKVTYSNFLNRVLHECTVCTNICPNTHILFQEETSGWLQYLTAVIFYFSFVDYFVECHGH